MRKRAVLAAAALVWLGASCVSYEHARSVGDYAERLLPARSTEGAERLAVEAQYDSAVRQFLKTHGEPKYLYVADRSRFYLFYPERDMVASFQRGLLPPAEVSKLDRIPGSLLKLLPGAEAQQLLRRRAVRAAQAPPPRKVIQRPRPPRAPAPAQPPAHGGMELTIAAFDVAEISARLRRPVSAADAGVSGWRQMTGKDGRAGRSGSAGSVRYVVDA